VKPSLYRLDIPHIVQKSLDKLQKQERYRIYSAALALKEEPRPHNVERLKSAKLWRIREGDYRIVYDIDDANKIITIVKIGHRREIYRGF
jgi:mRNA interferase RelE/StbE